MRPWPLLAVLLLPVSARAQASPYIPLDDPHLPAFELLVTRGEVRDPSPMVRPFRKTDALAVLQVADTVGAPARRSIQELRAVWVQDTVSTFWSLGARVGLDALSQDHRDPLHPADSGSITFYGELRGEARFGPLVMVSRPAVEPRLTKDPDWPGRKDLKVVGRMAEGYLSGQWRYGRLFYGVIDRQWGPSGVAGIPLSNYGYPRTELAIEVGTDKLRIEAHAAELTDQVDSVGGRIHRYWFAHRVTISPSRSLAVSLWETTIIGGPDRNFDARWRNPLAVLLLSDQYGLGADGNIMVGTDVTWWATRRMRLEGQFALDDVHYPHAGDTDHTPSRYAFTVAASGALSASSAWRLLYTQASSLAFRTLSPWESYTDAGVGLGRGYDSNDQLSLFVSRPVTRSWLVTPELTLFRQGASTLNDPWPASAAIGGISPLFIGTVERTWRAALGISGAQGPLRAAADLGLHYVQNAGHQSGETKVTPVARIRFTLGLATGGPLQ